MPDLEARHRSEAAFYDAVYSQSFTDAELFVSPEHTPTQHCAMTLFVEEMLGHMGPIKGKRILELGCGGGIFATYFALHGANAIGVDVSEAALEVARRRAAISLPRGTELPRFLRVPAEDLSKTFSAGSFDAVFGFAVAHHFDQEVFPLEVDAVLADGGMMILYEPSPNLAFLQRIRQSPVITRIVPVVKDTDCEEIFHRQTVASLAKLFILQEYPRRSIPLVAAERLVQRSDRAIRLTNTVLRRVNHDPRWPDGGCAAMDRLNRVDRYVVSHFPLLRKLCRASIIVGKKRGSSSAADDA